MHAKRRDVIMRVGMLLGGVTLLVGLLWAFSGSSHDPNHDINMEKAREAADRVHPQPDPAVRAKMKPGHGG
jgi:hypothetical protein